MSPDNQKGLSRSNAVLRLNRSGTDAGDRPGNIAGTERQVLETGTSKQREKKPATRLTVYWSLQLGSVVE